MTRFSQPRRFTTGTKSIRLAVRRDPCSPPSGPRRSDARRRAEPAVHNSPALRSGARSAAPRQRHLLYRAQPYEIDLLLELHPESNRMVVTGQVLDSSQPEVFRRGVRVTLWNFRQSFVTLRTNAWGEFWGEIEDSGELMVSLKVQTREIAISVRNAGTAVL